MSDYVSIKREPIPHNRTGGVDLNPWDGFKLLLDSFEFDNPNDQINRLLENFKQATGLSGINSPTQIGGMSVSTEVALVIGGILIIIIIILNNPQKTQQIDLKQREQLRTMVDNLLKQL